VARLEYDRYYRALEAETSRLADAVCGADLARPVPTCPEWTLARLAGHVGRAHRWAAAIVEQRATEPVPAGQLPDRELPDADPDRSAWLQDGASRLVTAVRAAGPGTRVWSWADEQTAGFWARRMVYETLVHRADAELALGRRVELAADLAADGIGEWLDILALGRVEALRVGDLRGDGQTLHFHATDGGLGEAGEWLVRRTPAGVVWQHGHGKGDAAVRAAVGDLYLLLMRRIPADDPRVELLGDTALVRHWLANTAF